MAKNSKIEWTDHTFNPWIGCTKVSPGCAHCYAETLDRNRFSKTLGGATKEAPISHWGKGAPRQLTSDANWRQPLRWAKTKHCTNCGTVAPWNALVCGVRGCGHFEFRNPRVFCASLADWLDDEAPIAWLARLLDVIRQTPNLDWLMLSKRPENWRPRLQAVVEHLTEGMRSAPGTPAYKPLLDQAVFVAGWLSGVAGEVPVNVWIGTTAEDQQRANERIPHLLQIPARVRFLSCEPLLGDVDLRMPGTPHNPLQFNVAPREPQVHWIIAGGESGAGARPMHPDWARSLRDQADDAGVPFLFKQWGEWAPEDHMPAEEVFRLSEANEKWHRWDAKRASVLYGKKAAGRLLDGVEHNAFPQPREAAAR